MALTVAAFVSKQARHIRVVGVFDDSNDDFLFRLGEEVLRCHGFIPDIDEAEVANSNHHWRVIRGQAHEHPTEPRAHAAGTSIEFVPEKPFATLADVGGGSNAPFALSRRVLTADAVIPADMSAVVVGPLELAGFDIEFGTNSALAILPDTP